MTSFPGGTSASGPLWATCVFQCFSIICMDNMDLERSQVKDISKLMVLKFIGLGYKRFDPKRWLVTLCLSGRTGQQGQKGCVEGTCPSTLCSEQRSGFV
jgi:hypothetical protein